MKEKTQSVFHHYVPQFQLRYLTGENGKMWVYDRKENRYFSTGPRSIGGSKKLYTYKDKGGIEHTEIEDLNTQIEAIAAPIIKDIHLGKKFITQQEKADLSVLLALNWQRTPSAKKRIELMMEAGITTHFRINALHKEIFYKQVDEIEEKTKKSFGDKEKLRQLLLQNRYRIKFDNLMYLQGLLFNLMGISEEIQRMLWIVVTLNEKRSFVLSDINFTVEQVIPPPFPYGNRGLWSPGSQSMCILTDKVAILMRPMSGGVIFNQPNPKMIRSCNIINAIRSRRFIFSSNKSLLINIVDRTKLYSIKPEKIGVEVYSGPEGKSLRFDVDNGLISE